MTMSPDELSRRLNDEVHYLECCFQKQTAWVLCRIANRYQLLNYQKHSLQEVSLPDQPRSQLNGYGGRCLGVHPDGVWLLATRGLYVCREKTWHLLYSLAKDEVIGDGCWHVKLNLWVGVLERGEVQSIIVIEGQTGRLIEWLKGADFYASPQFNDQGTELRWVEWDHPHMSWDESRLMGADVKSLSLTNIRKVFHQPKVSVVGPKFTQGHWWCIHDESGYWGIYQDPFQELVSERGYDFSRPQWVFDQPLYGFYQHDLYCLTIQNAQDVVVKGKPNEEKTSIFDPSMTVATFDVSDQGLVCCAKGVSRQSGVYYLSDQDEIQCLAGGESIQTGVDVHEIRHEGVVSWLWWPQEISSATLILKVHGGPTAMVTPEFDWKRQFWLANGFAFLEVNYKGSSGFGRLYRDQLYGRWGELDVEHCCEVLYQVRNKFNVSAVIAKGGSAGGMTALLMAINHPSVIDAVSCYYPVTSRQSLEITHRFEKHYCDRLISSRVSMPEECVKQLSQPVFICQGTDDSVVDVGQTRRFIKHLRRHNSSCEYHELEGEGHGFKDPNKVVKVLSKELSFYRRYLP